MYQLTDVTGWRKLVEPHPADRSRTVSTAGAAMEFSCSARQSGGLRVLEVSGDVDLAAHAQFQADVDRLWPRTPTDVVMDCSRVTFLDSMGLRVLVHAMQRAAGNGCGFALAAPSQPVLRVLELAGVTSLFSLIGPLPDAGSDQASPVPAAEVPAQGAPPLDPAL
jgi:stage II sporulation protein AA (anti-sigma F factor antagonist)